MMPVDLRQATKYGFCAILMLVFLVALSVPWASARPFRLGFLPDKGEKFGCAACHLKREGGGARNAFGQSWEKVVLKAGDKYTDKLGAMDSDGDGFTNDQEFSAGTNPGDPKSKPNP
jgi:hypothetical protein